MERCTQGFCGPFDHTIFALSITSTLVVSIDNFLGPKARSRALGNGAKKLRSMIFKCAHVQACALSVPQQRSCVLAGMHPHV